MKYMIIMVGDPSEMMQTRSTDWIKKMIAFMHQTTQDLARSGELAESHGLADPSQAKTIRFKDGLPVVTDGPFAEAKESLAGYWVVDVENEARAIEIAKQVVAVTEEPLEVRQVMDQPPEV